MRRRSPLLAAATTALLLLGGCAAGTSQSGTSEADTSAPAADDVEASAPPATDGGTPDVYAFTATTLAGEEFDGESLAGSPAVLWFWAPWCPTCIMQIPTVTGLAEEHGDEVAVVAVGGLDTAAEISAMAERNIPHVTHLVDDEGVVWKHFGVTAQSTFAVLDADGQVVREGKISDEDLMALVADLASAAG